MVIVQFLLEFNIIGIFIFCDGEVVVFGVDSIFEFYQWSIGVIIDSMIVFEFGEVSFIVIDVNGCSSMNVVSFIENVLFEFEIIGESFFCVGDSIVFQAIVGFESYFWNDGFVNDFLIVFI